MYIQLNLCKMYMTANILSKYRCTVLAVTENVRFTDDTLNEMSTQWVSWDFSDIWAESYSMMNQFNVPMETATHTMALSAPQFEEDSQFINANTKERSFP